jgi:cytochrome c oxidase cbb3-type subunit I/II
MPAYGHLMTAELDFEQIQSRVDAMAMLGVPYGNAVNNAPSLARTQALTVAKSIALGGGETGLETREIVALIAYMQRLGRDAQQVVLDGNGKPLTAGREERDEFDRDHVRTPGSRVMRRLPCCSSSLRSS